MTRGSACPMVAHLQAQLRQWYEHTPFAASFYDQPVMPAELYQEDMFLGALMYAACIHAQAVGNDLRIGCIVNPDADRFLLTNTAVCQHDTRILA